MKITIKRLLRPYTHKGAGSLSYAVTITTYWLFGILPVLTIESKD